MPREILPRHRLPHFGHLFASAGYAAGYYVYLWAEVLDADGYDAFVEAGDPFDPEVAERVQALRLLVGRNAAAGRGVPPRSAAAIRASSRCSPSAGWPKRRSPPEAALAPRSSAAVTARSGPKCPPAAGRSAPPSGAD